MTNQKHSSDTDTDAQRTSRRRVGVGSGFGITTVITLTLVIGVVLAASISPVGVVSAATDFSVTTTAPETVNPDETIDITYTIENTGDTPLESLGLNATPQTSDTELTITDAASDSAVLITEDNKIGFETVEPGASVTATLTVAVGTDATGTESLTAEITNGLGEDAVTKQTVTELTVATENTPPTANDVSVSTTEDTSVTEPFDASDPDGDPLSYSVESSPDHGTVSISGNSFTYTPDSDYSGSDSFTYQVSDNEFTDTATVSISVNDETEPPFFDVSIVSTTSPVQEGDTLDVTAEIENTGGVSDTQTVEVDIPGLGSDSTAVSLDEGDSSTETLTISTSSGDADSYTATVASDNDSVSQSVIVQEADDGDGPQVDSRVPENITASPGESVEITIEHSSDEQNIELYDEEIVTGQGLAEITEATSEKAQGAVSDDANSASALYLLPVESDTFSVTVEISEDASDGETIVLSGTIVADTGETSAGTTTITVQEGPILADYANEDDIVETDGLLDALSDWRSNNIEVELLLDVLDAWRSGDPVT